MFAFPNMTVGTTQMGMVRNSERLAHKMGLAKAERTPRTASCLRAQINLRCEGARTAALADVFEAGIKLLAL